MGFKAMWQRLWRGIAGRREENGGAAESEPIREHLANLQVKLGYEFVDSTLLERALLHRSHIHVTRDSRVKSNERLEFLGDAVLGLVVNEYMFRRYPQRSEGDLTKMKSLLVCGTRLSEVASGLTLGDHIRMSRSEAATGGRKRSSILADTMEALIGAVYLDGGLEASRGVIERCILAGCDGVLARRSLGNYKSRLQEMIQARYKSPPRYRVIASGGPDHARVFSVGVTFNGVLLGEGEGRNKKAAEQRAAQAALERLENEPELLDDHSE